MSTAIAWRGLFWISYAVWLLFEIWVFSRDRAVVAGEKRDAKSIYVLIAMLVLGIAIAFNAPIFAPFARLPLPGRLMAACGIALIWAGLALRYWAIRTLGRFFRTSVFLLDGHRLVTAGPYRWLRHPAYSGSLLTLGGVGLAMNNWVSILGIMGCALIGYGRRIGVEEKALGERFGQDFAQHRDNSWAVIPWIW